MANKVVEDAFRQVQESVAKLRQVIDQHEALQKDVVKAPAEPKPAPAPKTPDKK